MATEESGRLQAQESAAAFRWATFGVRNLALVGLVVICLQGCGGGGGGGTSASTTSVAAASSSPTAAAATSSPTPTAATSPSATPAATPTPTPTPSPATTSDFQPPTGAQAGADREAPGSFRIQSARSTDGLTFVPTGVTISDQANVPDMVVDATGRIWLYYTGGQVGTRDNTVAVATSTDQGATWAFHYVNPPTALQHAGDPDVLLLDDGTFRLFLTTIVAGDEGVVCLEGRNGIDFTLIGNAFFSPGQVLRDSTTYRVGSVWHMLTLQGSEARQRHGTSSDGRSFTVGENLALTVNGDDFIGSNPLPIDGGLRMYGFVPRTHEIRSFTTSDGVNFVQEAGVRLVQPGIEIKDPAVIRLADGTWFMVYVSRI